MVPDRRTGLALVLQTHYVMRGLVWGFPDDSKNGVNSQVTARSAHQSFVKFCRRYSGSFRPPFKVGSEQVATPRSRTALETGLAAGSWLQRSRRRLRVEGRKKAM